MNLGHGLELLLKASVSPAGDNQAETPWLSGKKSALLLVEKIRPHLGDTSYKKNEIVV